MKRLLLCAAVPLFCAVLLQAKPYAPTVYNSYDGDAPGARAIGMGQANTAAVDDVTAVYYNPAALAQLSGNGVSITYAADDKSNLDYNEIMGAGMLKDKRLVFLSMNGASGSVSWRPLADYRKHIESVNGWEDDEVQMSAFTLSAAQKHNKSFSYGLNLSYLYGRIGQAALLNNVPAVNISEGYGFSADFGCLYALSSAIDIGVNIENIAGFMWWDDYKTDQLPFTVRGGVAMKTSRTFTFAFDWQERYYHYGNGPVDVTYAGIEQVVGAFALRAGMYGTYIADQNSTHYTAGVGFGKKKYSISVAGEKYKIEAKDVFRYVFSLNIPL